MAQCHDGGPRGGDKHVQAKDSSNADQFTALVTQQTDPAAAGIGVMLRSPSGDHTYLDGFSVPNAAREGVIMVRPHPHLSQMVDL